MAQSAWTRYALMSTVRATSAAVDWSRFPAHIPSLGRDIRSSRMLAKQWMTAQQPPPLAVAMFCFRVSIVPLHLAPTTLAFHNIRLWLSPHDILLSTFSTSANVVLHELLENSEEVQPLELDGFQRSSSDMRLKPSSITRCLHTQSWLMGESFRNPAPIPTIVFQSFFAPPFCRLLRYEISSSSSHHVDVGWSAGTCRWSISTKPLFYMRCLLTSVTASSASPFAR